MCGLTGLLTHKPEVRDHHGWVVAAAELMRRRGPDDVGYFTDDHTALGFRRLSVIDTSDSAHQPMMASDGRSVLAYNGEVYNFRQLREELASLGYRFKSQSDTEVVLNALRHWGAGALARFDGMFALAFYDLDRRQLLLARDPVGIKPLYVLEDSRGIVFGSQYDQVIRHPWCNRERTDSQGLGTFLRLGWVPPPLGLIAGTRMLEAGTVLTAEVGGRCEVSTFRSFFESDPYLDDPDEVLARVDSAVEACVESQLVADVPVGVFLSGGIDSPLVAATAHQAAREIPAFTIGSDDPHHDETEDAIRYADTIGITHVQRTLSVGEARARIDDMVAAYSEPFSDHSALPTLLVSELAREQVTVALSGDGGDELFWGYERFSKMADAARWFRLPRPVRRLARQVLRVRPSMRPPEGIVHPSIGEWQLNGQSYVRGSWLSRLAPDLAEIWEPPDGFVYDGPVDRDSVLLWLRRNEWRYHLQMILMKVDRASMFHSLEVRVPLLGHELVSVAEATSHRVCIEGATGKLPLRRALAGRVGESSVTAGKRGFTAPIRNWLANEMRDESQEILFGELPFAGELLDTAVIKDLYRDHVEGSGRNTRALWALLVLQRWADAHLRPLPVPRDAHEQLLAGIR